MKKYTGVVNYNYDKIQRDILEYFDYEFPGEDILLQSVTEEFNCLCPWSDLPDFANLRIEYIPNKRCIELKSLKLYIVSFRHVGIFHEHSVNVIFDDLARVLEPKSLKITLEYKNRGGFVTTSQKSKTF